MADFDFPADLLELQRAFNEADAECERISDALPSATAILDGADVDYTELDLARAKRLDLAVRLQQHPWWQSLEPGERVNAKFALRKAAKAAT